YEETGILIPAYLGVCIFICGVLGWGFYQLMRPAPSSNPGLAAYKAPPVLGITSLPASTSDYHRTLPSVANASDLQQTADETTGRATQAPRPESAAERATPPPTK